MVHWEEMLDIVKNVLSEFVWQDANTATVRPRTMFADITISVPTPTSCQISGNVAMTTPIIDYIASSRTDSSLMKSATTALGNLLQLTLTIKDPRFSSKNVWQRLAQPPHTPSTTNAQTPKKLNNNPVRPTNDGKRQTHLR